VAQTLRHAAVASRVASVRVQREPFDLRGTRVEPFAEGSRFSKHSLWHIELELETPVSGPLLIGDGRFCGLGLMKPVRTPVGVFAFAIESGLTANPDLIRLARALRRAVMARARDVLRPYRLPPYFTGHRQDGTPARSENEPHLAFLFDPLENHLLVIAPECLDRHLRWQNQDNWATLESALHCFSELRAGPEGHLRLRPVSLDLDQHPFFAPSHVWESVVNRHAKRSTAEDTLKNDLIAECERRGLPRPEITVLNWNVQRRSGLTGRLRLSFKDSIQGPIVLGKTRHVGGGVFSATDRGET